MSTNGNDNDRDRFPTQDELRIYETFRKRVVEEDTLINQRVSWIIWAQASLIATWGLLITKQTNTLDVLAIKIFLLAISSGGWIVAVFGAYGVHAAQSEINRAVKRYSEKHKDVYRLEKLPRIIGNSSNHSHGNRLALGVALLFALIQFGFFVYTAIYYR